MTFLCLRVDLDYVPWDTPDAREFGHAEPAVVLRMLELAKGTDNRFHFFASTRALLAFPSVTEAVLNEGHDLDWLCKKPEEADVRFQNALPAFEALGYPPIGFACKTTWQAGASFSGLERMQFISANPGPKPEGIPFFPVDLRTPKEAMRAGLSVKSWSDAVKLQIRETVSRHKGVTLVVRPQVLGRYDPKLVFLQEVLDLAAAVGAKPRTLRSVIQERGSGA